MEIKKYYPVLCLVAAVLFSSAFGQAKSSLPGGKPVSPGRVNPALVGIDQLYIDIVSARAGFGEYGQFLEKLRAEIGQRIVKAGIKMYSGSVLSDTTTANIQVLRVNIDMLSLSGSGQNIFLVRTSLSTGIYLPQVSSMLFKVDVWMTGATVEATSVQSVPAAVAGLVTEQVEAFISAYLSANQQSGRSLDSQTRGNIPVTAPRERARPAVKPPAAKYKYVASKNSRVFHKPECSSAKRILPKNLVAYSSRAEAIKSGKRPCKRCEP